jgi:GntR family transcriptional regulator
MWFRVDPRSPIPVYRQVVEGVKEAVAKGVLASGERVPSVRELAARMTLNHNTVARAYQELEREGVIEVVRGRGAFVSPRPPPPDRERRIAALLESLRPVVREARYLEMQDDEVVDLVRRALAEWRHGRGGEGT